MEIFLNEAAPKAKDVPHRQVKGICLKLIMVRAFFTGMHYGMHVDLGRAVGVSDYSCHFETASVCPAYFFGTFLCVQCFLIIFAFCEHLPIGLL